MFQEIYTLYIVRDTSAMIPDLNDGDYILRTQVESAYKPFYRAEGGKLVYLGHLEDFLLSQAADQGITAFKSRLSPKTMQRKTTSNSLHISEEELALLIAACRTPTPSPKKLAPQLNPNEPTASTYTASSMHSFYEPPSAVPNIQPIQRHQEAKTKKEDNDELEFSFEDAFNS